MNRLIPYLQIGVMLCATVGASAEKPGNSLPDIYRYRAQNLPELRRGFAAPPRQVGPWVYWFWFDNVVNRQEITRELEEMAAAGISGVELRCVSMHGFEGGSPGPWFDADGWKRLEHQRLEYLSPPFVDTLEHTLSEAARLGLYFSINLGMGWPPGGRWIPDEHRSKHLLFKSHQVSGPDSLAGEKAVTVPPHSEVSAWRLADERNVSIESFCDLTGRVNAEHQLEWQVPVGEWVIGVFTTVPGGLCDKGEGPEADPASARAVQFHLQQMFGRLEPKLRRFFGTTLVEVASDSWEYARPAQGRYWSPALADVAGAILPYELKQRRFALLGYGPDQQQILSDLERVECETIQQHYFEAIAQFLHPLGLRHRPQVYGRGLQRDLFAAYALADVPEIEEGVYVPEAVWAARLLGKAIISAEAFTHVSIRHGNLRQDAHHGHFSAQTDPEKMWRTTPKLLRALANAHFARGINRIQIHSFSYSPPGVPPPGWRMYAEIHLNRNVDWWPEVESFSRWTAEISSCYSPGFRWLTHWSIPSSRTRSMAHLTSKRTSRVRP